MRFAKLLLVFSVLTFPSAALAQQSPDRWAAGVGVGLTSHGAFNVDPGKGRSVRVKDLSGETIGLGLNRQISEFGDWSVRAGAELNYSSARTDKVMDGDLDVGSAHLSRWSGFALVTAKRDLGVVEPYVGVGAGLVSDRLVLRRTGEDAYREHEVAPAAKVLLGMDFDTKPVAFGVSVGVTDTFDRKSTARFGQ